MVVYIIILWVVFELIELENEVCLNFGINNYLIWDFIIDEFLRSRSFENFVFFWNYGEYGGLFNLEYYCYGLSKVYWVDIFYDWLVFMFIYVGMDKF